MSCGSINAILRLTELYIRCVGAKKSRLYGDNPSIEQSQSEIAPGELQGVFPETEEE